jgi:hypothetical protein
MNISIRLIVLILTADASSFCQKIPADPSVILRACEPEDIKGYLEWRVKRFRIKKESTIKSYWKRISCGYIDLTGRRIDNGTELDVRDVNRLPDVLSYFRQEVLTSRSGFQRI